MCALQFSLKGHSILLIAFFALFVCVSVCDESQDTDEKTFHHNHNPSGSTTIVVTGGSHSHATREDIKFLQEQINEKSFQIDAINQRLTALEYQTKNLSRQNEGFNYKFQDLTYKYNYTLVSLESLRQADMYLNISLSSSHTRINLLRTDVTLLESFDNKLRQDVEGLNQRVARVDVSVRHLNEVNQLWRSNFRALNTTITNLRKKVDF